MSDSFDNLSKIIKEHKLHIVEDGKDEHNLNPFTFYKEFNSPQKDSIKVGEIYLKLVGRMVYSQRTNHLEINWPGNPPELVIMGMNSHLKKRYNQEPKDFILKEGELKNYKIIKA